jgi:hypothetical protein
VVLRAAIRRGCFMPVQQLRKRKTVHALAPSLVRAMVNVLVFSSCFNMRRKFPSRVYAVGYLHAVSGTNRNVLGMKSVGSRMNK